MIWSKDDLNLDEDWGQIQEAVTWLGSQFFYGGQETKDVKIDSCFQLRGLNIVSWFWN